MNNIIEFIQEKLKLNKNIDIKTTEIPNNKRELCDIIKHRYNENQEILDLSDIDISNITNLEDLFKESLPHISCLKNIKEIIGIEDWNTSNVTNMSGLFKYFELVTKIDVSDWDVSNVEDMSLMFFGCKYLKNVGDLSKWNTKNLKKTNMMFVDCGILSTIGDISKWNINKLKNAEYMFQSCKRLKLDISNWPLHMTNSGISSIGINYCTEYVKTRK